MRRWAVFVLSSPSWPETTGGGERTCFWTNIRASDLRALGPSPSSTKVKNHIFLGAVCSAGSSTQHWRAMTTKRKCSAGREGGGVRKHPSAGSEKRETLKVQHVTDYWSVTLISEAEERWRCSDQNRPEKHTRLKTLRGFHGPVGGHMGFHCGGGLTLRLSDGSFVFEST